MEKNELIICQCHSTEHMIVFRYDDDPEWEEIYAHIHLSPNRGFWKRLWAGLKYAFGHTSKYGHFDEVIIKPEDHAKFQRIATHLKKSKPKG